MTLPLDRRTIRRLAGTAYYERGLGYFEGGRVGPLAIDRDRVAATVQGTREYRVRLRAVDGEIDHACTCPLGDEREFCKHCVAVALSWLEDEAGRTSGRAKSQATTMDDVRAQLRVQDKEALVEMIVEQALEDDRLREQLLLRAARHGAGGPNVSAYLSSIDRVIGLNGFVDYNASFDYARGVEEMTDQIQALLDDGHAGAVIELSEHALVTLDDAMGVVDDSSGNLGWVSERLHEIHYAACEAARPEPEALARRLFRMELERTFDLFYGAATRYADILGPDGLAVYRRLAEQAWANIPALGPGEKDEDSSLRGRRFRVTGIMESLTKREGDVEARVDVKRRDLSLPYGYLQIAELYRDAGEHDRALEWAEQGLAAFPDRPDSRLQIFLADEYRRRERHADMMSVVWDVFADQPGPDAYRTLESYAEPIDAWPEWRERAIEFLRRETARRRADASRWKRSADHSSLVKIFLHAEDDVDAAWREAQEGGCSDGLWLALAERREEEHPEDALPIFQHQVQDQLGRKNKKAYAAAVEWLERVRELLLRVEREDEFEPYLESVRSEHRRKRNFMKLLAGKGWD